MKNRITFGLGALVSALVLGSVFASAPAFAQDTVAMYHHHHHHYMRRYVSEPQMPPMPKPCIHVQTYCL